MDSNGPSNREKLTVLIENRIKNVDGLYVFQNLDEFNELFPEFLDKYASKDELKIKLDKRNGLNQFITLDVKY